MPDSHKQLPVLLLRLLFLTLLLLTSVFGFAYLFTIFEKDDQKDSYAHIDKLLGKIENTTNITAEESLRLIDHLEKSAILNRTIDDEWTYYIAVDFAVLVTTTIGSVKFIYCQQSI